MPMFRTRIAHPLDEMRDDFERVWSALALPTESMRPVPRTATSGFPAVNVAEDDDAIIVEAELPGLDATDVEISVKNDELVLRGSRAAVAADDGDGATPRVTWHRRERGSGPFERRLTLPVAIDAERVEARLVDGVLTVTCPKAAEAQPRKVEVRVS
jgi:HSP20 family protein